MKILSKKEYEFLLLRIKEIEETLIAESKRTGVLMDMYAELLESSKRHYAWTVKTQDLEDAQLGKKLREVVHKVLPDTVKYKKSIERL